MVFMYYKKLSISEKWTLNVVPILFIFGSLLHFFFAFTGNNKIAGLISAVNESVWEHSKMVLLPIILFWSLYSFFNGKKYSIDINKWFTSALVSLLTALITIPIVFYFYTQAFGVELLWVDIGILLLALIFGQLLGLHFYRYGKGVKWYIPVTIIILIVLIFMIFTFFPPQIPIYSDSSTVGYGIV